MTQAISDLSVLARAPADNASAGAVDTAATRTAVPLPKPRWKTRVLLPALILTATGATLLFATGSALWPATPVRVVPVVAKTGVQAAGKVIVQAPGWVEADPFPAAVSALADGVVAELLVLEGQPVEANQVVARLVADDAQLGLAKAEAALHGAEADLAVVQADLKAAQREWDNPVEQTRKLATSEAELAERRAELARWPAELAAEQALAELEKCRRVKTERRVINSYSDVTTLNNMAETYLWLAEQGGELQKNMSLKKAKSTCHAALREGAKMHPKLPKAMRLQGTYEWLRGKHAAAQKWWQKSLTEAERMGLQYDVGMVHLEMGQRLGERAHMEQAEAISAEIGAELDLAKAREFMQR